MVMTEVLAITGEYDRAIDQLAYLLSIPSFVTVEGLRLEPRYLDPWWKTLRAQPRFQDLLATKEMVL